MTASSHLVHLEWDSAFFGFPTGKLVGAAVSVAEFQLLLARAQAQGWRLLYWFVPPDDRDSLATAQALGGILVDDKRTYARRLPDGHSLQPEAVQRVLASDPGPDLISLAVQSGEYSRFRRDANFGVAVFERLYTQWLNATLHAGGDAKVLAYRPAPGAAATGLLTLEERGDDLNIGLLAVDRHWRQRGIAQALLAAAYHEARLAGFTGLRVVTQGANQPALRFYEQAGFELVERQLVFHWWLPH